MGLILAISATSTFTAFAGWEQTGTTWKYNSNGTYFNNGWNWIDGNGDGIAECYYFNADGLMLANIITPDNFTVNEQGAWTVNGVVQTKQVPKETQPTVKETAPQATEAYVEPQPEPQPEPQQNNTNTSSGGIDTSGWDLGGGTVEQGTLDTESHLTDKQIDEINSVDFN